MAEDLKLYTFIMVARDGTQTVKGYAYGEPWVAQALAMGDIRFDTEEEARAWWEKTYG